MASSPTAPGVTQSSNFPFSSAIGILLAVAMAVALEGFCITSEAASKEANPQAFPFDATNVSN
jgi:hypothetical protein